MGANYKNLCRDFSDFLLKSVDPQSIFNKEK